MQIRSPMLVSTRIKKQATLSTSSENSSGMPTTLTWSDVALRLTLTALCAGILGFDRDERGRSAGLRTILLVGLAAALSMIQANWLINSNGKPVDSFVVMDIMRLPLGILSGIGFIGAGAIIKRGELAVGVTTAATIWFVTVMGLCFGGGQIALGLAGFALGFIVLVVLKRLELRMKRQHSATLRITVQPDGPSQEQIIAQLRRGGVSPSEASVVLQNAPVLNRIYGWKLRWKGKHEDSEVPSAVRELSTQPGIAAIDFTRSPT